METISDSDCVAKTTSLITFDSAEMSFPLEQRTNGTRPRRTHRSKHPSLIGALPQILSSEPPNGRRILNSVEPRGGRHGRNYSLPVVLQTDVHWSGAVSRRKRRTQTSSLASMLFGQKREGTFVTIHGNALFGQVDQPSTNARDDDDLKPTVEQESRTENYRSPTNEESSLTVAQSDNREITPTSQQSVSKLSASSDLQNQEGTFTSVKKMDRFVLDDASETDVIVDTAKHAFRQTVQNGFSDSNKSEASSSCGDLEAVGLPSSPVNSGAVVCGMMTDSKVFGSGTTHREERSSDVNPPLSDDEERLEPRLPDSGRSLNSRGFQIGHHSSPDSLDKPRGFLRRKSTKTTSIEKPRTPMKQVKKPNRLRFFIECFGGRVLEEDQDSPAVFQSKDPDSNVLPSRRVTDDKKGQTHRYTRRQAFIRTMMESHLDNHRN